MIIILKKDANEEQIKGLLAWIRGRGLEAEYSCGEGACVLSVAGDASLIDVDLLGAMDVVERVQLISEPYRLAGRNSHPSDTVIDVCGNKIGGRNFQFIAGQCSVESEEQIVAVAKAVKAAGATVLRGGAFKPRTSPYAFQGLGEDGLKLLLTAKRETGMPVVSELVSVRDIDLFEDIDIIQVGARNMQNFELLKELGRINKPVLLKRGLSATVEEWLMSAEYIMSGGNERVILCERGIRTFEPCTRNTLDLSAVPLVKEKTHLPIFVDPSHASGLSRLVTPLSLAAVGAGADGLMIEVHNNPTGALCDGAQSLCPSQFEGLVKKVRAMLPLVDKI